MPEALVRAPLRVVGVGVGLERAAEHLHEGEPSDEGVRRRLEDVHHERPGGVRRAAALDELVLAPEGRRQQPRDLVQQRAQADAADGADGQHRHDVAGRDGGREGCRDALAGQVLAIEVELEQLVVGLGDGFDQLLAARLDGVGERRGRLADGGVGAQARLAGREVDDAREGVSGADRDRERDDLHAVALAQRGEHLVEVGVLAVHPRDDDEARQPARVGELPGNVGAGLDAGGGVDGDERGVGGGDAADDLADEVEVAGRVDHVEALAGPLDGEQGERDRVGAGVLLLVEVGDGVAVLDAAEAGECAGGEEHRLAQHRLAGAAVPHQDDVAELLGRVGIHGGRYPRSRGGMVQRGGQGGLLNAMLALEGCRSDVSSKSSTPLRLTIDRSHVAKRSVFPLPCSTFVVADV